MKIKITVLAFSIIFCSALSVYAGKSGFIAVSHYGQLLLMDSHLHHLKSAMIPMKKDRVEQTIYSDSAKSIVVKTQNHLMYRVSVSSEGFDKILTIQAPGEINSISKLCTNDNLIFAEISIVNSKRTEYYIYNVTDNTFESVVDSELTKLEICGGKASLNLGNEYEIVRGGNGYYHCSTNGTLIDKLDFTGISEEGKIECKMNDFILFSLPLQSKKDFLLIRRDGSIYRFPQKRDDTSYDLMTYANDYLIFWKRNWVPYSKIPTCIWKILRISDFYDRDITLPDKNSMIFLVESDQMLWSPKKGKLSLSKLTSNGIGELISETRVVSSENTPVDIRICIPISLE